MSDAVKFQVCITETLQRIVSCEAATAEEAMVNIRKAYAAGDIVLTADNSNVETAFAGLDEESVEIGDTQADVARDFAPPGYYAVPCTDGCSCSGCAFDNDGDQCGKDRPCCPSERPDGRNVRFLAIEEVTPTPTEEAK